MTRIIKPSGYIYINAPTSGPYHCFPGDNWRFYSDAGQALAYWSGKQISNEHVYPVNVVGDGNDFVCVWKRGNADTTITVSNKIGILENTIIMG